MKLDESQLQQVEELGALMFSVSKIAIIIGVSDQELRSLVSDSSTAAYMRYNRGKLLSESEVRTSVLKLAKQGSSPAQTLAKKYSDECELENIEL